MFSLPGSNKSCCLLSVSRCIGKDERGVRNRRRQDATETNVSSVCTVCRAFGQLVAKIGICWMLLKIRNNDRQRKAFRRCFSENTTFDGQGIFSDVVRSWRHVMWWRIVSLWVIRDKGFSEIASTGCFRNFVEKNVIVRLGGWVCGSEVIRFDGWGCSLVDLSGLEWRFVRAVGLGKVWLVDIYEV